VLTCLAVEDRIFSTNQPQAFFTMFGNMGGAASADLAIEGFEDDLKLTGRSVSQLTVPLRSQLIIKILNVLATVNENPYIRYYQPVHHAPLGPLANTASSSTLAPPPQQSQSGQSLRWRSAMGGASKVAEPVGDYLCKKIAVQVQNDLDEYMVNNPEFPVSLLTY
jgi:syntaxin-binding protein 1